MIRGLLSLPASGTATASAGFNSQPEDLAASVFNSDTSTPVPQTFQWQAEPVGNNTSNATGSLNLLFAQGTAKPSETGLNIASNGQITFANGQSFPGTITGVTTASGSGLTGGGTSGNLNLALTNTCTSNQVLQWNGSAWVCGTVGVGTVTSVGLSAPALDFTVSGSPITGAGTLGLAWNIPPDTNNTANAIVKRDGGGSFSANRITATELSTINNTNAIYGASIGLNETAIFGASAPSTGAGWGVEGITESSDPRAFGVIGEAASGTGTPVGTYGLASSPVGIGVFGQNGTESSIGSLGAGTGVGVWGDGGTTIGQIGVYGTADDALAGAFINNSPSGFNTLEAAAYGSTTPPFLAINFGNNQTYCQVDSAGNLNCSGAKHAVVPIDGGKRKVALSAIESPMNWFEDVGSARLVKGVAVVTLDSDFIQTVNTEIDYKVFPVPNGDCNGLYVTNKTATSFEVRELGGGASSVVFDYRIMALRRKYENERFADHTHDLDSMKLAPERMKAGAVHQQSHDPGRKTVPVAGGWPSPFRSR
jgi:hypothetical protein